MNRTFRKAIACILAVLMVVTALPFTAFAAQNNRKWWTDSDLPLTEEPTYWGYNSPLDETHQPLGPWEVTYGTAIDLTSDMGYEDHRDDYKPIVAVTVSGQGTAGEKAAVLKTKVNKYYGYSPDFDYDTVKANGNLLDPANLKAGQRIAVTLEFGGVDTLYNVQFKGKYLKEYIQPGAYAGPLSRNDTWKAQTDDAATAFIRSGADMGYGSAVAYAGQNVNPTVSDTYGTFYGAVNGGFANTGDEKNSNFIGTGASDGFGARPFGKYGIASFVLSFQVLKDCNLADVISFDEGRGGTYIIPYAPMTLTELDGKTNPNDTYAYMTFDDNNWCCANIAPVIWSESTATGGGAPAECTHSNAVKTEAVAPTCVAPGNEEYWTCPDCSKMFSDAAFSVEITEIPTIPATGVHTYGGWVSNNDGTHSKTCSACHDVSTVDCTYTRTVIKEPTYSATGTAKFTCDDCGYSYTEDIPKITCAHAKTHVENAKEAKCGVPGYTGDVICDDCGATVSTGTTIDALKHNYVAVEGTAVASTCKTKGKAADERCSLCGDTKTGAELALDANNHEGAPVIDAAVDATCMNTGLTQGSHCGACGTIIDAQQIIPVDENNHTNPVTDEAVAEDCTNTGLTQGSHCDDCGRVIVAQQTINALGHNYVAVDGTAVAPTKSEAGKAADEKCSRCNDVKTGAVIPALGYNVTIVATDLGTVTLDGEDVTAGATVNKAPDSTITLKAVAAEGAEFVGWVANDATTVSTSATFKAKVLADVTYEPVFQVKAADKFTVVFVDAFGNVVDSQSVTSGSQIQVPAVPTLVGYDAAGWSMTNEEIAALTEAATITAKYTPATVTTGFTVKAVDCTITISGVDTPDQVTGVAYDTQATVSVNGATYWTINGAVVAYGDAYTFYVGSDVEVVPHFTPVVTATPTVSNVSLTAIGNTGAIQAAFLATRSMTDDCAYINAGFVYGKNLADTNIDLDSVDGTTVKVVYCTTTSEQFQMNYGLRAQTGTITARAFLAYADNAGNTVVIYALPQTFSY